MAISNISTHLPKIDELAGTNLPKIGETNSSLPKLEKENTKPTVDDLMVTEGEDPWEESPDGIEKTPSTSASNVISQTDYTRRGVVNVPPTEQKGGEKSYRTETYDDKGRPREELQIGTGIDVTA